MSLRGRAAPPPVRAFLAVLAALGVVSLLGGCASSTPVRPHAPERIEAKPLALADGDEAFLVEPLAGFVGTIDPERRSAIDQGHRGLRQRAEIESAASIAAEILALDPGSAPAAVLAAQAEFARGDHAAVLVRLVPIADRTPDYTAAQLVLGRSAERLGDVALAYAAYRVIAARSPLAFERAGALHARALETVHRRLDEALDRGEVDAARRQLGLLEAWGAAETATLEAAAAVARAGGDRKAELIAVRGLAERHPEDHKLLERRADLELAIGDPSAAVSIVQSLVDRDPQDRRLLDKLDATKFRWRITFLPPDVRELATRPTLNRAELAVLLYWLVPEVRYARPTAGRIAADVLDQPRQEEIIRVVNLGLLDVDTDLHRFHPTSVARRAAAFSSFLRVLQKFERKAACLAESLGSVCAEATRCGLLSAADECRPREGMSGAEAVEAIRKLLGHLGGA